MDYGEQAGLCRSFKQVPAYCCTEHRYYLFKKAACETRLPEADSGTGPMSGYVPDQQLLSMELSSLIEQTVQALPPQCQLVYRLIKEEELSYKEAGAVLELSQNTLETHMRLALKKLRRTLDAYLMKKKS